MRYNNCMKYMRTILLWVMLFFSGCQLFEDSPELQQKKHELALKKIEAEEKKHLADLEMQKSLADLEKQKALELQKLQNSVRELELQTNSEKELELISQKVALQESNNLLAFQKYLLAFLALLLIVVAVFVFYYLKRKREDELRAYNDNLKKYFYFKENEARMKIAEKILDTIAEGDLSKENEQKLINAFSQQHHEFDAEVVEQIGYDAPTSKD